MLFYRDSRLCYLFCTYFLGFIMAPVLSVLSGKPSMASPLSTFAKGKGVISDVTRNNPNIMKSLKRRRDSKRAQMEPTMTED